MRGAMKGSKPNETATQAREKLDVPGTPSQEQQTLVKTLLQQGQKPEMKSLPPSELLDRLQTFLPALKTANADLASRPAEEICLEHTGEDGQPHIALDLACGVFDLKDEQAAAAADRIMSGAVPDTAAEAASDSDSDSEINDNDSTSSEHVQHKRKDQMNVPRVAKARSGNADVLHTETDACSQAKRKRKGLIQEL